MIRTSKKIEKIIQENSFEQKKRKPRLKFNPGLALISLQTTDYNFGIDDGAELKFGTHKEHIVLNILKDKYCVNKSRDMSIGMTVSALQ